MAYLQVRLEPAMKTETEMVLDQLGLSMTQAVKLFFKQITMRKAIPFPVVIPKKRSYAAAAEEAMIEESLQQINQGQAVEIDMTDKALVKKYF
jgi:addiction module RelB/DinJ family antitoxin